MPYKDISMPLLLMMYEGCSINNEKNTKTITSIIVLQFIYIVLFECNAFFPVTSNCFYAINEELFIYLFKPVIYGMNVSFIALKCLST